MRPFNLAGSLSLLPSAALLALLCFLFGLLVGHGRGGGSGHSGLQSKRRAIHQGKHLSHVGRIRPSRRRRTKAVGLGEELHIGWFLVSCVHCAKFGV